MPSSQIERKLAAIMFTDIAGYTEQMSKDESVAISLLNKKESVLKLLIAEHNGTYVKSTGEMALSPTSTLLLMPLRVLKDSKNPYMMIKT